MQYGFIISSGDIHTIVNLTRAAEAAGWDAAFYWDGIYSGPDTPMEDPWVAMTAMAAATSRIRIGSMLMPLSRHKPWIVARQVSSLDRLSGGRFILPVGLGATDAWGPVPEVADRKTRAELLDECLAIVTGLWTGEPFSFSGAHYQIGEMTFLPTPIQQPVPIWVVGLHGSDRSMARVLRYQGLIPNIPQTGPEVVTAYPDAIREMRASIAARHPGPFDIIAEGRTSLDPAAARAEVQPYADAGATWWVESMWTEPNSIDDLRARIHAGPPRR